MPPMEWKFTVLWNQNQVAWIERQRLNPSWQLEFEIKNLNWNHQWNWNQVPWIILASDSTILENIPMEWVNGQTWNITLSDAGGPPGFLEAQKGLSFSWTGHGVEGDGNRTGAEASNRKGNGIWVDPGAAKVFDVVDGQGSLVDGRGEDDDGVRFVAKVAEAGGGIEWWVVDDGSKGADAFGWLLEVGVVLDGRGPGFVGCDSHDSVSCEEL
jgi:hypothetical protein